MDPVDALARLGGTADDGALRRLTTRRRLKEAVGAGKIRMVAHGRYALATAENAAVAAVALAGVVSHLSAVAWWGWECKSPPERPEVTVPRHRKLRLSPPDKAGASDKAAGSGRSDHDERRAGAGFIDAVTLRRRPLDAADLERGVTGAVRTVLDCAESLNFAEALTIADSAIRAGDVDSETLAAAASKWRGRGAARVRRVAAYADGRSANVFESVLRAIAIEAGLAVVPQWRIDLGDRVAFADLANPLMGLVIEADSWGYHATKQAFSRDLERYNLMVIAGWVVLRFTFEQVMDRPAYVRSVMSQCSAGVRFGPERWWDTPGRAA